ncbi:hypothetical protein RIF29_30304 [Crotalaria pallida]|uniref:Uncharacterized protein n=1 Tax=Crotalaria pallida TaxID=3830 RepID=A0AAN9EGU0_CROPI
MIDARWKLMHSDLHSAGYFLNPQFQYGVEHGVDVYRETFEGTSQVIMRLERNMENQILALNQNPIIDTDDENENMDMGDDVSSGENSGGLSPPSDGGGNDGGNVEAEQSEYENEQSQNDPYHEMEMPYHRRDGNLIVDFTAMPDMVPSGSIGGSRRGESSQLEEEKINKMLH